MTKRAWLLPDPHISPSSLPLTIAPHEEPSTTACYLQSAPHEKPSRSLITPISLNKQKYTFIMNTIAVIAYDLGEAGYRHSSHIKTSPTRGRYVMPPEASSIDTLLSRSKELAAQMQEKVDD